MTAVRTEVSGFANGLVRARLARVRRPSYTLLAHPMSNTGAPLVLLDLIRELVERDGSDAVRLLTPAVSAEPARRLAALGVRAERAVPVVGRGIARAQLALRHDDVVLMNTLAVPAAHREVVLEALERGRLRHAHWFVHEDPAQLPIIDPGLLDPGLLGRIGTLVTAGRLTLLVPSAYTKRAYDALLGTDRVRALRLRVDVGGQEPRDRPVSDYARLDFLLSGTAHDGRKGHLLALAAFREVLTSRSGGARAALRPFSLHLAGVGADFVGEQVRFVARSMLAGHAVVHPLLPRLEALALTARCNAAIGCSLNETFGLAVAEGMAMGHVVLRNDTGGVDEQLHEGVNGFRIAHGDLAQFASVIARVLDRDRTTDADLRAMGAASRRMVAPHCTASYLQQIPELTLV